MLGDEALAKDVVQETMVTVWQKLKNIKSSGVYMNWIYKIVINKCRDHLRHRKRNPEFRADEKTWLLLAGSISQMPSSRMENDQMAKIIAALTDKLSPKQRTIFILSDLEGMTSDEISDITGNSKLTIKANLSHARKSISGMIGKYL